MTPEIQVAINILFGVVMFLGGFLLNRINDSLKELRQADNQLANKVERMPMQYVLRDDYTRTIDALFAKLDRIETKIDGKADKE